MEAPKPLCAWGRPASQRCSSRTQEEWREDKADQVLAVARSAIELRDGLEGCDFDEIAEDLACEARIIKTLESTRSGAS